MGQGGQSRPSIDPTLTVVKRLLPVSPSQSSLPLSPGRRGLQVVPPEDF